MGKPTGFLEYERQPMPSRKPAVRLNDWYEIYTRADEHVLKQQGARCMDCGVAFCQSDHGCPIDNLIPEWNDLVYHGRWREAYERLSQTNNFPEFTGRICPAPCESACVLGITDPPVTIKSLECAIIDKAFENGWVRPTEPKRRTGKTVAVIGSGPAGLAAADQLNKAGHTVTVYERDDRAGGLLMYGVPNMKLEKKHVQRRIDLLEAGGVTVVTRCDVGTDITADELRDRHDAVLLACGALKGRELSLPGASLDGVGLAMPYLSAATRTLLDEEAEDPDTAFDVCGQDVIVIGGGDTGADCIATALRQGCKSILNITRREQPPTERDEDHPWPGEPGTYYLDYAHAEGAAKFGRDPREFGVLPLEFIDDGAGRVKGMQVERLAWERSAEDGRWASTPTGQIEFLPAQRVFLAIGFTGHDTPEIVTQLGVSEERWGTVKAAYGRYATDAPGVFVAGDMRRGASLVVWAIAEGRGAARAIDEHLMGTSDLPAPDVAGSMPSVV